MAKEPPLIQPAWKAASKIGQALGIQITLQSELRGQPVLIEEREGKPQDLLAALAKALHASVLRASSGSVSVARTKADAKQLRTLDREQMGNRLRLRLELWDRELGLGSRMGPAALQVANSIHADAVAMRDYAERPALPLHRSMDPELLTPAGQLLRRLVTSVGVEELSSIGPGEVRVFSSKPTAMESPIPGASRLVQSFVKEEQAFASDPALQVSEDDVKSSREGFVLPRASEDLSDVTCTLTASRNRMTLNLSLEVFDIRGNLIAQSFVYTELSRDNALPFQRAALTAEKAKDQKVELSTAGISFLRALRGSAKTIPAADPFWKLLLHPETFDPANYLVPSALAPDLQEVNAGPLVAVVPDDLVRAAEYSSDGTTVNRAAFKELLAESSEWISDGGLRILRPKDPLCSERYTSDRTALREALERFKRTGQVDLRGWSVLANREDLAFSDLPRQFVNMLVAAGLPIFRDTNAYDEVFQVLGAIPDGTWDGIGRRVELDLAGPELRSPAWTCLQRCRLGLARSVGLPAIAEHASVLFPDGVPREARLVIAAEPEFVTRPPSDAHHTGKWDSDIVAFLKSVRSLYAGSSNSVVTSPGLEGLTSALGKLRIVPCRRIRISVSFDLAKGIAFGRTFASVAEEAGPAVGFSELPEDFRSALLVVWNRIANEKGAP